MRRTHSPATTLPRGRRLLIALVVISSAASPPLSPSQDFGTEPRQEENIEGVDSLSLHLLELEIEEARDEAEAKGLWSRLIPSVRLSASIGIAELYFQDEPGALLLPRDTYRITFSLLLNSIFDAGPQQKALYRLERLKTEHEKLCRRLQSQASERRFDHRELRRLLEETEGELGLRERIARFYRMRFEQGAVEYPTLARAELEILALRARLRLLKARIHERKHPAGPENLTSHQREKSP